MSKINAVRIINLNYNNNGIKISDEIFEMHGETTLLTLDNGGGKSVLVQMMLAPFVHKRYQNAKDRPFASYFTTNKPTFVMVEWLLDKGAGYVLTGMMVRKSQEVAEENANELEMINFICEYKKRCNKDLYHLGVVEKSKKEMVLKNFGACRQLFETCKSERDVPFFYYDMNNAAQQRQYFDKLMEYQINYREWENIVKKINLEESGLSKLFQDCRDEKGLVEKWFLESVEQKLNKEKNRMQEFQSIMEKYILQYRDNQSKIRRRDAISSFQLEAEKISAQADEYQKAEDKKQLQEERIADFMDQIKGFQEKETQKQEGLEQQITTLLTEIAHLEYARLSHEIYELEKEINFHTSNREMIQMEADQLEQELFRIQEHLHGQELAKLEEQVREDKEDYQLEKQRLLVCQQKAQDLEPERKELGAQLKQFYQVLCRKKEELIEQCEKETERLEQESEKEQNTREELAEAEKDVVQKIGEITAKIKAFDAIEDRFNQRYQANFGRNILGQYESGMLYVARQEYEKSLEEIRRTQLRFRKELQDKKEKQKSIDRMQQDLQTSRTKADSAKAALQTAQMEYDRELEERRVILRYFQLDEEVLFDRTAILNQTERKIRDTRAVLRNLENEELKLQKEYQKLTQGKVLELSEEFEKMLEDAGITPVYGMEWLLKNKKSTQENKKLVEEHPFLPYALIMTRQELADLKEIQDQVYTSTPIPILVREDLESIREARYQAVQELPDISFYVWFNENLLDEEKLAFLVKEKEQQIKKAKERVEQKNQEQEAYVRKQEKIRNQKVDQENYQNVLSQIQKISDQIEELDRELTQIRQQAGELETQIQTLDKQIIDREMQIRGQEQRLSDFAEVEQAYLAYEENCTLQSKKAKEQERLIQQQKLCRDKLDKLGSALISKQNEKGILERELEKEQAEKVHYDSYDDQCDTPLTEEAVLNAKMRYQAITSRMTGERQELEQRVERALKRLQGKERTKEQLLNKYGLKEEEIQQIRYDAKEESHQETQQEDHQRKIQWKNVQLKDEEKIITEKRTECRIRRGDLKKQCDTEELLPKEEIQDLDFEGEINARKYQKKEIETKQGQVQKKVHTYEELLTSLAEYSNLTCNGSVEWDKDLSTLTGTQLVEQKGFLIRDYNEEIRMIVQRQNELEKLLNGICRLPEFQEEFYQKPLEALLSLTGNASQVQRQLETILQSFQNLMEKLLVDISFVEKEKAKVAELMEDYLKEVHENLGKIDHNSTIQIRGKSIKMLRIQLQNWEEEQSIYHLRLADYIESVTEASMKILDENGNIGEFLGRKITTNALYDAVAGIGNVQIHLFKIEAQREYPITWSEVAKNSGGEGFLSAFVILSSLLYYMRRDESDIFADRNEGKVLIMDNPFAQTNAAHLLRPLMEMAKKTNTQLICLTGLSGESIYSCFDNIYALELIAANLRSGMQYLKADHMRGSQEETMITAQIEVMEQQELIF